MKKPILAKSATALVAVLLLSMALTVWRAFWSPRLPKVYVPEGPFIHSSQVLEVRGSFESTNAIQNYFDTKAVPIDVLETRTPYEDYCLVSAYPYSGVDTTDLYCFVRAENGWILFLNATLWYTAPGRAEFRPEGSYLDVICNGKIVLKIDPLKERVPYHLNAGAGQK